MYKTLNISNFETTSKKNENLIDQKLISKIEQEFNDSDKEESFFKEKVKLFLNKFLRNSNSNDMLKTNILIDDETLSIIENFGFSLNKFDLELNDEPFETIFFNCYYTLKNTSESFDKVCF